MTPHASPPTKPVQALTAKPAQGIPVPVEHASDLDDATLEQITLGMVEKWRPQMKFYFFAIGVGVAFAYAMVFLPVPSWLRLAAWLPLYSLIPAILWKQKQLQNQEADRLGVSRKLLTKLWQRQMRMGFRPRIMWDTMKRLPSLLRAQKQQHEYINAYMRRARDELASKELKR